MCHCVFKLHHNHCVISKTVTCFFNVLVMCTCIQPLPASIQPVFCMAMHGVVACFTQAGNKERRVRLRFF